MSLKDVFESTLKSGGKIEFNAHSSHLEFGDNDAFMYASLGYYVNRLAALEFDIDAFMLCVLKTYPDVAFSISRNYPVKMADKIAFIVYSHVMLRQLRECGDIEGNLNLQYIYYGLLELFDSRNFIVHGKVYFSEQSEKNFVVSIEKYTRVKRGVYEVFEARYTSFYLEKSVREAHYFQCLLWAGVAVLKGDRDPSADRKKLMRGRARFREFMETVSDEGDDVE